MLRLVKSDTYSYATYLDSHREQITRENYKAIVALRQKGWLRKIHRDELFTLAAHLRIPYHAYLGDQQLLGRFLDTLYRPFLYEVIIRELKIRSGTRIGGHKVRFIRRDRHIILDNGDEICPTEIRQ